MQGWYKAAVDRPPHPSRVDLAMVMRKREEFYRHAPPPGEPILVGDLPLLVDDYIPEDKEITW